MFEYFWKLSNPKASNTIRNFIFRFYKIFIEKDPGVVGFDFSNSPSRLQIVQNIIDYKKFESYLEIGTFDDELFSSIKCNKKIGVDPSSGGTHRMTSDLFFKKNFDKFDCIFIDGLHHYKQVKRDINNSIKFLNDNGVILIHDCLPNTLAAQIVPRIKKVWNGDVWKAFVEQRTNPNLDSYTCYADHGIGIILKRKNSSTLDLKITNFKKLKFNFFHKNHKKIMNIIDYDKLLKII